MRAEAGTEFTIRGEPHLVARLAEVQIRHRADEAEMNRQAVGPVIKRRAVTEFHIIRYEFVLLLDDAPCLADTEEIVVGEHIARADRHQLDEAERDALAGGEFDEVE